MSTFDEAHAIVSILVKDFADHESKYLSSAYQEAEVRKDFIDKFLIALGWDVNHDTQKNPYEQEVKVERSQQQGTARKRADYAFSLAPNFRDVRFFAEAKKPSVDISNPQDYFQTLRYGWNSGNPLVVITDFEQFHILDSRYKPNVETALNRLIKDGAFYYKDYLDVEKFSRIYWLFSREAVASGSIEKFATSLPKPRGGAKQLGLFKDGTQKIDESFLEEIDEHRLTLARAFKKANNSLDGETLTELVQRTLDRLVFIRFLEDRLIEPDYLVAGFGQKDSCWNDFIATCRRLDGIYNGIVFKNHTLLDARGFEPDDTAFAGVCESLSHLNSPFDFNAIPIHILGSIYERFLGKIIVTTAKQVKVVDKPAVRKNGGVFYTPEYIVRYIVKNTIGSIIKNKNPEAVSKMRFSDIACGSGSFLLGVFEELIEHYTAYYNTYPKQANATDCFTHENGSLHLTLKKRRGILLDNIYGVDVDPQAVEVAQLSLFLRLLQDETTSSAKQHQLEFHETLLPSLANNIKCGNSLVGTDILQGHLFEPTEERKLNPMDFKAAFPKIIREGGFDAVIGNPPYRYSAGKENVEYFKSHFTLGEYQTDFYVYFVERALSLLKAGGYMGMIVTDAWLKGKYFKLLRNHLLENTRLNSVTVFNYAPFKDAVIECSIPIVTMEVRNKQFSVLRFNIPSEVKELSSLQVADCLNREMIDIHSSQVSDELVAKIGTGKIALSEACELNRGIHAYRTDGYGKSVFSNGPQTKRDKDERVYHSMSKLDDTYLPEIKGKHLERYFSNWDGTFVSYGGWLAEPREAKFFKNPKVAIRKIIAPRLVCTYLPEKMILDQSIYVAIQKQNSKISLLYILGILASSIGGWFLQRRYAIYDTLYPWFTKEHLANFPIKNIDFAVTQQRETYNRVVNLVTQMLTTREQLSGAVTDKAKSYLTGKCESLDSQIDELVYELYELSDDEIELITEGERNRLS